MGRWQDDGYGDWDGYSESRPRKVEGGLKAKSERGAIGETWWSKRWVQTLESLGMGARLTRGRSYARRGQVLSIGIEPGQVKAKVQGSLYDPYTITIRLQPLAKKEWEKVTKTLASQAIFAAKLLAGEMPKDIEAAFVAANLSLFPTTEQDLRTKCSCPDWANPCKHIAAVYYILAEQFDADPFLIFKLRGCTKEELIESLRKMRTSAVSEESGSTSAITDRDTGHNSASLRLEEHLNSFWQAGEALETFVVNPTRPEVDQAILKRLGSAPFSVGKQNLTALLAQAYDAVETAALSETAAPRE